MTLVYLNVAARADPGEGGNRYSERNVRKVLDRARKAASEREGGPEVGWVHFHTFRHTCASLLFEGGKNVAQVAAWLGHADPAFTLRTYVHLLDDGLGDVAFMDSMCLPCEADSEGATAAEAVTEAAVR